MHRIDEDGHVGNQFTEGNPALGVPATKVGDDWLNAVQEELAGAIEGGGLALEKADNAQLATVLGLLAIGLEPGGRLTLTSGAPVTTADALAAGTVYYTPHRHDGIALYDGTRWRRYTFAELAQPLADATQSPAAATPNANYDVFVWDDAGTLRATRGPAWSSDTDRGAGAGTTELERLAGRMVNRYAIANGPAARRGLYVGTIRTDAAALANDGVALRHVWNAYNRVARAMRVTTDGAWNSNTTAWRQAGGAAANQLDYVQGLSGDPVAAEAHGHAVSASADSEINAGVGVDSTTVNAAEVLLGGSLEVAIGNMHASARYEGAPGIGRHRLVWLERSSAASTSWGGSAGFVRVGIVGRVMA